MHPQVLPSFSNLESERTCLPNLLFRVGFHIVPVSLSQQPPETQLCKDGVHPKECGAL